MKNLTKRVLSLVTVLALCLSLLSGLGVTASAATVDYVTGYVNKEYGTVIKNWGTRGTVATFLSPNAEAFYAKNNVTYEELSSYAGSSNTSSVPGSALYRELNDLVKSNQTKTTSYDDTKELFAYTDCQGSGIASSKISSFYSGTPIGPSWDGGWNREHTWPNSKGDANGAGENDIMMLRPTSTSENSSRGNKAYGEVNSTSYYNPNTESGGKYDLRGDVARIMLYVYTRWGTANMWGASGVIESKEVLLKWMQEDPVDTWEMGRNDSTESIVGTRNVYVDYPELAFCLFGAEIPTDMETPSGIASGKNETYTITVETNNDAYGTVSVNGRKITAFPATGYYTEGYTVTAGQASVVREGDVFVVTPESDCTIRIDFKARAVGTYTLVENNHVLSSQSVYLGDTVTLPDYTGAVPEGYTFLGWVTEPMEEVADKPADVYKAGDKHTLVASVNFYSLFARFDPDAPATANGLFNKHSGEVEEGSYMLISGGGAMKASIVSSRLAYTDVTVTNNSVSQPTEDLVWKIESTGDGYYTIYNEASGSYAASTGAKNKAALSSSVNDNSKWEIFVNSKGNYEIRNKANDAKGVNDTLLRNTTFGFACYASTFDTDPTELYKLSEGAMLYTTAVGSQPVVPGVPGDITGEGEVNNDDVVLLLWHTLFPEEYPLGVSGDINKDGSVNNDDVVLLLWHTLFPEEYPL